MPERISVPGPDEYEEARQWAETFADMHYVAGVIVENATQFVPGEAVQELDAAWQQSDEVFQMLVHFLAQPTARGADMNLHEGGLIGAPGKLKRSMLGRLKDRFLMYWNSEPRTRRKTRRAAEAAQDYLELGATVVGSIPGWEKLVELVSVIKQLIGVRSRRGI